MSMTGQISTIWRSSNFYLRHTETIKKCITKDACSLLVHFLITSRLDYANYLLYGIPNNQQLKRLQRSLYYTARIITLTSKQCHISHICYELHCMPIRQRINFKILLHIFKALNGLTPGYIRDMLTLYRLTRTLRSTSDYLLIVLKSIDKATRDKSFSCSTPNLWEHLTN